MLTLAEAAARLGMSAATLRWQIKNGKLRARKVGPVWTVTEREVERYDRENRRRALDRHEADLGQPCEATGAEREKHIRAYIRGATQEPYIGIRKAEKRVCSCGLVDAGFRQTDDVQHNRSCPAFALFLEAWRDNVQVPSISRQP